MEAVPHLRRGAGSSPSDGGCIMQITDWVSSGGWSDRPACVHSHISSVAIAVNDALEDEERQQLLDLIPRFLDTNDVRLTDTFEAMIEAYNRRWYGPDWQNNPVTQPDYSQEKRVELLLEMLDKADELLGRTSHDPVDLTGVCELMTTV